MEDMLFVRLKEPKDFRKNTLEGVKELIHSLQRFENIKNLKKKAVEKELELKSDLKELNSLANKLERTLPQVKIHKPKEEKQPKSKAKPAKIKKGQSHTEVIEDLASQLKEVEEKLRVIS